MIIDDSLVIGFSTETLSY